MPSLTSSFVRRFFCIISAGLLLSAGSNLTAQEQAKPAIELGLPFRDNAILQREMPVPVWGWCKPESTVTGTGYFPATANEDERVDEDEDEAAAAVEEADVRAGEGAGRDEGAGARRQCPGPL
jgi:hypothetical protein